MRKLLLGLDAEVGMELVMDGIENWQIDDWRKDGLIEFDDEAKVYRLTREGLREAVIVE